MSDVMVWDADDFGVTHVISPGVCESHDCRDKLDQFHYANPKFKATLFAIPAQMTFELLEWCAANRSWVELAVHGIFHGSNYECVEMTKEQFNIAIQEMLPMIDSYFVHGFKAPGWQISDGVYEWLVENGWWVADQSYNNMRRPASLSVYLNSNGKFSGWPRVGDPVDVNGKHHHTWDCMANGVYESSDEILDYIKGVEEFKFVSEVLA